MTIYLNLTNHRLVKVQGSCRGKRDDLNHTDSSVSPALFIPNLSASVSHKYEVGMMITVSRDHWRFQKILKQRNFLGC